MIIGIKESRTLTKHASFKCDCKFDSKKSSSNINWNCNKCPCVFKNPEEHCAYKKVIFGILQKVGPKIINI